MRISFVKILVIIFTAVAVALLINFLRPDGLPLFNDNNYKSALMDENINPPPAPANHAADNRNDTIKQDYNKMAVEKNRVQINEDLLPSYDYKSDSALSKNDNNLLPDGGSNTGDVNLSNLTRDVFNQPRLISLTQAYELYRQKVIFVDARNPEEYEEGHIAGAINIPYFSIDQFSDKLAAIDKTEPLVTYCEGADCDMAIRLGNELFTKGYKKVFVFFGGWEEWENADYPVVSSNENLQLN
jgi:rhodanese-related sulfurtransferase